MDNFRMIFEKPKLAKNRAEKKESRPQDFFDNQMSSNSKWDMPGNSYFVVTL
jgi:hypothetical protein